MRISDWSSDVCSSDLILDQKLANLNPDFFSYTLTKAALEAATTMLAQSLAPRVRVNAVSPGLTLPSLDQTAAEFATVARENLLQRPIDAIGRASCRERVCQYV